MRSGPGRSDFHWLETDGATPPQSTPGKGRGQGKAKLAFSHAAAIKDYKRADAGTDSIFWGG